MASLFLHFPCWLLVRRSDPNRTEEGIRKQTACERRDIGFYFSFLEIPKSDECTPEFCSMHQQMRCFALCDIETYFGLHTLMKTFSQGYFMPK